MIVRSVFVFVRRGVRVRDSSLTFLQSVYSKAATGEDSSVYTCTCTLYSGEVNNNPISAISELHRGGGERREVIQPQSRAMRDVCSTRPCAGPETEGTRAGVYITHTTTGL